MKNDRKHISMGDIQRWLLLRSTRFYVISTAMSLYVYVQFQSPSLVPSYVQFSNQLWPGSTLPSHHASTAPVEKPNIILFFLDQWRYDWDGFHSSPTGPIPIHLPFFASMASRGTRFSQAYVPSPVCGTVRACLASGKEYDHIGMNRNHADDLPTNTTTFYRLMRDEGYHTMTCGKDDLFKGDFRFPYFPGIDYLSRDGLMDLGFSDAIRTTGKTKVVRLKDHFDPYRTYLEQTSVSLPNGKQISAIDAYRDCFAGNITPGLSNCQSTSFTEEQYPDTYVQRNAIKLLDRKPTHKPWFLQINFPGPHPPFLATKEMAESVAQRDWPAPYDTEQYETICPQQEAFRKGEEIGPQRDGRCNYAAQIEHIDSLIEQTIRHLDGKDELDGTLVCITGDHGEMLGDHGQIAKSKPWQGAISVPLLCFGPGIKEGYVYEEPITTLDLPGTFLDYAGYGKAPHPMTTRSLRPLLQDYDRPSGGVGWGFRQRTTETAQNTAVDDLSTVRNFVSSGYANWRAVIKVTSDKPTYWTAERQSTYKLICCKGACPGAPKSASPVSAQGLNILLYDTIADPFDMIPLEEDLPSIVEEMMPLLPNGWCVGTLNNGSHTA